MLYTFMFVACIKFVLKLNIVFWLVTKEWHFIVYKTQINWYKDEYNDVLCK